MNKYTMLILGDNRSGTTSVWKYFGFHKQITPGIVKEQLQRLSPDEQDLSSYIQTNFHPTDETKVFLDATPNLIKMRPHFIDLLKSEFKRVCCIYAVRPPLERLYSYTHILLVNYDKRKDPIPYYINKDLSVRSNDINYMFIDECMTYRKLWLIEQKIGRENMYVVNLKKLSESTEDMFKFLKINQQEIPMNKANMSKNMTPTLGHIKVVNNINKWVKANEEYLKHIEEVDKLLINKRYGDIL